MGRYADIYRRSLEDPEGFWAEAAEDVIWQKRWDRVLDNDNPPHTRWFVGGQINTCYNALDRHVAEGRGAQAALIHDSPVTGMTTTFTYAALRDAVAAFAGVLRKYGVGYGDRVIVYMPMIPEAVIAMLACTRIGAIHSVVFGGFAATELAKRITDATPKLIVSASCGIEPGRVVDYKPLLDGAIEQSPHKPATCIIVQRAMLQASLVAGRDIEWLAAHEGTSPADCVNVDATDPVYILYTSGTTGLPKGVVRPNAGHLVALKWSMRHVYDVAPGETFWAASDVGWVVGHSYIVYAPLFHGCTTVLYEGKPVGTPDAGAFWRVISQHKVSCMFTAPTAMRAIKKEDPAGRLLAQYDMSHFRDAVRRRRTMRPQHIALDRTDPEGARDRSLVADRKRLADGLELPRYRKTADPRRISDLRGARLGDSCPRFGWQSGCARRNRRGSPSSCRCRQVPCQPFGTMTRASWKATCPNCQAITRRVMPA